MVKHDLQRQICSGWSDNMFLELTEVLLRMELIPEIGVFKTYKETQWLLSCWRKAKDTIKIHVYVYTR